METIAPPDGIVEEDWAATPVAVRQVLAGALTVIGHLQQQLVQLHEEQTALRAHIADLEARLNQHAQNSSKPPSADPPSAPPRPARTAGGRAKGGQKGHERHDRPEPLPDHIDTIRDHYPLTCPFCQECVKDNRQDSCLVQTQFVWDLPVVRAHITAHHYHTVCCRGCGALVSAQRPADVPPGAFGPRTAASVAVLRGDYHLSVRAVARLLDDFFGLPLSVGSVVGLQQTASAAIGPLYETIHTVVQQQAHCNVDETSWKENGKRRWLWTMVTAIASFFVILRSRNGPGLWTVVGVDYNGIVGSDRHKPYLGLDPARHQFCWSHLNRNFQVLVDRKGRLGVWGADLLALSRLVFRLWHLY